MRRAILSGLVLLVLAALPALAEEGEEGMDPVSAKVKAQMEKIIRLMRQNEQALIEISTGGKAKPKQVDVDVEVPPSRDGSSGSSEGANGGASGNGASEGGGEQPRGSESVVEKLDELVNGQRNTGEKIPGELEELVRMVPQ